MQENSAYVHAIQMELNGNKMHYTFSGQFRRQCMHFGNSPSNFGGSTVRRPVGNVWQPQCRNWLHFYRITCKLSKICRKKVYTPKMNVLCRLGCSVTNYVRCNNKCSMPYCRNQCTITEIRADCLHLFPAKYRQSARISVIVHRIRQYGIEHLFLGTAH